MAELREIGAGLRSGTQGGGVARRTTLRAPVSFDGTGLHSGAPVRMTVAPAPGGAGITFRRTDIACPAIPARWDMVEQGPLATRLRDPSGVTVSTIEHVMAALAGVGVHDAAVTLTGPEVPIMDGSAAAFARGLTSVGTVPTDEPLRVLRVLSPVTVRAGAATATLSPHAGLTMRFDIDFPDPAIGRQSCALDLANGAFLRELAVCRTFCRAADIDAMHRLGLARGGSVRNAVVFDGATVRTPGGLRRADEPVRHKMLDALGDLACAGLPILGAYHGHRAGHALTNALLRALFADPSAWRIEVASPDLSPALPGTDLQPRDLAAVA
ncbi:MAG: UDP-3-O-acyl-N-acetylglucosamine deacetylase [Paracoccaceae bacterium]